MPSDQMGVLELAAAWRSAADKIYRGTIQASTLHACADQLERAIHNDDHDAEFKPGCKYCAAERRALQHAMRSARTATDGLRGQTGSPVRVGEVDAL